MKCQTCSQETILPFRCPFCGGQFCSVHHLPENHACPRIDNARTLRREQVMTSQSDGSYNYSYVFGQQPFKRQYHARFSQKEFKHLGIATALVMGIGTSIGLYGNFFGGFPFEWTWAMMAAFAVVMVASFLTHEIGHKLVAQKNGLWAEFRLTMWGAVLTFASVFLPFKMIAPGVMMISGTLQKREDIVKISIAGPIANIIYASVFIGLAYALPIPIEWSWILLFSAYINAFMAVFNLIPFGVLDGFKIFSANKTVWISAFIPSIILTLFTYWMIF